MKRRSFLSLLSALPLAGVFGVSRPASKFDNVKIDSGPHDVGWTLYIDGKRVGKCSRVSITEQERRYGFTNVSSRSTGEITRIAE